MPYPYIKERISEYIKQTDLIKIIGWNYSLKVTAYMMKLYQYERHANSTVYHINFKSSLFKTEISGFSFHIPFAMIRRNA